MKAYTDIEQSQKLSEILSLESADMWWAERYAGRFENFEYIVEEKPFYYLSFTKPSEGNWSQDTIKNIPCWSLSALLDVINQVKEINHQRVTILVGRFAGNHWYVELLKVQDERAVVLMHSKELVDACYEMIIRLHELKLL